MARTFDTTTIIATEQPAAKWDASFRVQLPTVHPVGAVQETISQKDACESLRREIEDKKRQLARLQNIKKEEEAEKAFLKKWDPVTPQTASSGFWNRTPSRLYWALSYNHFEDEPEKQLEMAKDLLAIYGESANPNSSSFAHAKEFVKLNS